MQADIRETDLVWVSDFVSNLVYAWGVTTPAEFEERGGRELKGVSGTWRLHAAADVATTVSVR